MTAVSVRGLTTLRRKLEARALPQALKETARKEAEMLARDAAQGAPGDLGRTVEVKDMSHGNSNSLSRRNRSSGRAFRRVRHGAATR